MKAYFLWIISKESMYAAKIKSMSNQLENSKTAIIYFINVARASETTKKSLKDSIRVQRVYDTICSYWKEMSIHIYNFNGYVKYVGIH